MEAMQNTTLTEFLLMEYPYGKEICLAAFTLYTAEKISNACEGRHMYWAESLILSLLITFGGGIIAPFLIGRPPVLFVNDLAVLLGVSSWFLLWQAKPFVNAIMDVPGARQVFVLPSEIFRLNSCIAAVNVAAHIIPAGPHYPIPLWGPVLIGTISGCGGLFLPLDRGLSALKGGAPDILKSSFLCSLLFHLAANDPTVKTSLVVYVGEYTKATAAAIIIGLLVTTSVIHSTSDWFHPTASHTATKRKTQ